MAQNTEENKRPMTKAEFIGCLIYQETWRMGISIDEYTANMMWERYKANSLSEGWLWIESAYKYLRESVKEFDLRKLEENQ